MLKDAKVRKGKTPASDSKGKSSLVKNGEAVSKASSVTDIRKIKTELK